MIEQTTTAPSQSQSTSQDSNAAHRVISAETVLGFSVIGCMVAGVIAIFKATEVGGRDAAECLLVAVAAFATVCWIYFRKN